MNHPGLRVGVDASNLRDGGGVTHLYQLLSSAVPEPFGIASVTVWGGRNLIEKLPLRPWLHPVHVTSLDRDLATRTAWRLTALRAHTREIDVLLAPGGVTTTAHCPVVVMCRNMLPFEETERARFGNSPLGWRLRVLRELHARSLSLADGAIFLSRYATQSVLPTLGKRPSRIAVIAHGVDDRFRTAPRPTRESFTRDSPLRVLYVSQLSPYKHNVNVARAITALRQRGLFVSLDLVGGADREIDREDFERQAHALDPKGEFIRWKGAVQHAELIDRYRDAEVFAYASSCENLPNTLVEAMASGLPIASSDRGPMPEVLARAGVYFDPEDIASITRALDALARSATLRESLAERAYTRALERSWRRCADDTFAFVGEVSSIVR